MALSRLMGLVALAALPGVLGSEESSSPGSLTVILLLLLLLALLTGLALAWYHLNRQSGGYYHPSRLGTSLWSQARRLMRATGGARWFRGSPITEFQDSMEKQEEEEDLEPEGEKEVPEKEEPPSQNAKDDGDQTVEGPGQAWGEACPQQGKGQGPEPSEASTASGGSAEALLSDLHAFSGSAAWEDGAGTAGQDLSVTAL